jgi:hypothetical protein
MLSEKYYTAEDVCKRLKISMHTLTNWYYWEKSKIKKGEISKPYLPEPERDLTKRGNPRLWTYKMVKQLEKYKASIVIGRNGNYGEFTNPLHKKSLTKN